MSADNYYLIRKREDGKFVPVMGFMSSDDEPVIQSRHTNVFDTVSEALHWAMDEYTEYGVSVHDECGDWWKP